MANTYFRIKKEVEYPEHEKLGFSGYKNNYDLSLTAFCGNDKTGNVQLTIQTESTIGSQNGTAYITLNDNEIDLLIAGLLERKLGKISATSNEQSSYCPSND